MSASREDILVPTLKESRHQVISEGMEHSKRSEHDSVNSIIVLNELSKDSKAKSSISHQKSRER